MSSITVLGRVYDVSSVGDPGNNYFLTPSRGAKWRTYRIPTDLTTMAMVIDMKTSSQMPGVMLSDAGGTLHVI